MVTNFKIVGDHLAQVADKEKDQMRFDLFSRSAFNRYYYSAFLTVRTTLDVIGCTPEKPTHTNVRQALRGQVSKGLKLALKHQKDHLTPRDINRIRYVATTVVNDLEQLLGAAYSVRHDADYYPGLRVKRTGSSGGGKLSGHTISAAKLWPQRAESYAHMIQKTYVHFGITSP